VYLVVNIGAGPGTQENAHKLRLAQLNSRHKETLSILLLYIIDKFKTFNVGEKDLRIQCITVRD
jgi:hypothetical protein